MGNRLEFESQLCHLLALTPWASYLCSRSLSLFIYKLGRLHTHLTRYAKTMAKGLLDLGLGPVRLHSSQSHSRLF